METRSLDPADIDRSFDVRTRSFGALPAEARPQWEADVRAAIEQGRVVAVYDGDLLVGRANICPFAQWWGGRLVTMAGIAGVVVAPEYRGRGAGTALMEATIDRGRELGYPLSVLYPATVPVYRRQGWEFAGTQNRVVFESRLLRDLRGGSMGVREARADDAGHMVDVMRRRYAEGRACGPMQTSEAELREQLADDSVFAYVAAGGFVLYSWAGSDLLVHQIQAGDTDTARALWSVVGSGSSVARQVHAYLAPDDPVFLLVSDNVARDVRQERWMLRCLDVVGAISERGYPLDVSIDVPVVLGDAQVPANRVAGRLRVGDGAAELVPGVADAHAVRLGANGLAALYAGTPMSTLVVAGLAAGGDPESHARLDSAFGGRRAYLLEYF